MKILITGVSSGIGLSLAGLFQREEVWGLSRSSLEKVLSMVRFLVSNESDGISGRFISAQWDDQRKLLNAIRESDNRDAFKLRRIVP